MSYDPKSDLVALKTQGIIESYSELNARTYGVIVGENGDGDKLISSLPDQVEFDEQDGFDIVVIGNSNIGIVRT